MDWSYAYKQALADKREIYLSIKARPGAPKTGFKEIMKTEEGEVIKLDVAAAPEKGRANREIIRFLSGAFDIPKGNIKILSGAGDKLKLIKLSI